MISESHSRAEDWQVSREFLRLSVSARHRAFSTVYVEAEQAISTTMIYHAGFCYEKKSWSASNTPAEAEARPFLVVIAQWNKN
jgi:hypothetical protein